MSKTRNPGPEGHYYCPLPRDTEERFHGLMKRYGLTQQGKIWRNGDIVAVNWCKRARDGKIVFLVYEGACECDSLEELDRVLDGEFENYTIMLGDCDIYEAVEKFFDSAQAHAEGWGLDELDGVGLQVVVHGPKTGHWNDEDALYHVLEKANAGSSYHRAALDLVSRWEKEHNCDE